MFEALGKQLGEGHVKMSSASANLGMSGGSDDFANISQRVPSVTVSVCAGSKKDGYIYPLHNPLVEFDERALSVGAEAYACVALDSLKSKERHSSSAE